MRGGTVAGIGMVEWQLGVPYVRTSTDASGKPIRWKSQCVTLTPDTADVRDLTVADVNAIIDRAMANWMTPTRGCSDVTLVRGTDAAGETRFDGTNRIELREDRWCRPASGAEGELCHSPFAAGLTRVFYVNQADHPDDGTILDADIEINAVDFALAKNCETTCETLGSGQPQDLENTLTHELGHFLGLGHTCWDGMDPPDHPEDDAGQPIPFCEPLESLPQTVLDATMYPYGDPTQTIKRSIEPDEVTAICEVYGSTPGEDICTVDLPGGEGGCACSIGGETSDPSPAWLLLLLAALSWKVRRWHARGSA